MLGYLTHLKEPPLCKPPPGHPGGVSGILSQILGRGACVSYGKFKQVFNLNRSRHTDGLNIMSNNTSFGIFPVLADLSHCTVTAGRQCLGRELEEQSSCPSPGT